MLSQVQITEYKGDLLSVVTLDHSPHTVTINTTTERQNKMTGYEDKAIVDEIKAELEETRDLLKDKIIDK